MTNTVKASLISGAKTVAPFLVGVIPFGTITGVTMVSSGIAPLPAVAMSFLAFAGSAQLAATELISKDAPTLIVIATALVINLRFMMYSASIAPHFSRMSRFWRYPLAFLLSDQAYAISVLKFQGSDTSKAIDKRWFFLGCGFPVWLIWQISTLIGVGLGLQVPASWSLDFAIPLTFLSLLLPSVKDGASVVAAICAGGVSVAGFDLPLHTGIIAAIATGIAAGFAMESVFQKKSRSTGA